MEELKQCPFCGSKEICSDVSYETKEFRIYCCGCSAEMVMNFCDCGIGNSGSVDFLEMYTIMDQLIEAWNRRVNNAE